MEIRRKRCSAADRMVNLIYMDDYFTSFRLVTQLGVITFEQQACSTKIGYVDALSLDTNS